MKYNITGGGPGDSEDQEDEQEEETHDGISLHSVLELNFLHKLHATILKYISLQLLKIQLINRPGVARAVLQSPPSLIHSFIH